MKLAFALISALLVLTACGGNGTTATAKTRVVQTDGGPVTVPTTVTRVVTTHNIATESLVDLGLTPVGIGGLKQSDAYPGYWAKIQNIPQVSKGPEPNVEKIAGLKPDVIFAVNVTPAAALAKLREIAPVVLVGIDGAKRANWQARVSVIADVIGRKAAVQRLASAYAQRAAQIKQSRAAALARNTINVLDTFERTSFTAASPTSMIGKILVPAGARFAPSASAPKVVALDAASARGSRTSSLSNEDLGELTDGTVIFHGSAPASGKPNPFQQALLDNALFKASAAARAGHVYPIGTPLIAGYTDAMQVLDFFDRGLAQAA